MKLKVKSSNISFDRLRNSKLRSVSWNALNNEPKDQLKYEGNKFKYRMTYSIIIYGHYMGNNQ